MRTTMRLTLLMVLLVSSTLFTSCNDDDEVIPDAELASTKWSFDGFNLGDIWTEVVDESVVTIEFKADGSIEGSTGCNGFTGNYTVSSNQISILPSGLTLIACEDDLNIQESNFIEGLANAIKVTIEGNKMNLYAEGGNSSLVLTRIVDED